MAVTIAGVTVTGFCGICVESDKTCVVLPCNCKEALLCVECWQAYLTTCVKCPFCNLRVEDWALTSCACPNRHYSGTHNRLMQLP